MAFSLFRKKQYADIIFTGGRVRTLDPDYPEAQAIAVKDGLVLAVGEADAIEELKGKDTEVFPLDGATLLPGFIDLFGTPSKGLFSDFSLKLGEDMSKDDIIQTIKSSLNWQGKIDEEAVNCDTCFAFGFSSSLFDNETEEDIASFREALDAVSGPAPVILLSADGLMMRLNTAASVIIKTAAEDMGVEIPTHSFILGTLLDADYSKCIPRALETSFEYAKKGYTSVLNLERTGYFENIYRDVLINMYQAGLLKQRAFGSFTLQKAIDPAIVLNEMNRRFTCCLEVKPFINSDTLVLGFSSDEESANYMSEAYLDMLCEGIGEHGYNIRLVPKDSAAAVTAFTIAGGLAEKYRKQSFSVIWNGSLSEEEFAEVASGSEFKLSPEGGLSNVKQNEDESFGEAACRFLTQESARILGHAESLGTLETGAPADFAIFPADPLLCKNAEEFEALTASAAVMGGAVIYDRKKDSLSDWQKQAAESFSDDGDFFGDTDIETFDEGNKNE